MKPIARSSQIDLVIAEYKEHMFNVAGLRPATCRKWSSFARRFLLGHYQPLTLSLDWGKLSAPLLLDYVRKQSKGCTLVHLQSMCSALRSFCRFLCLSGRCSRDWSGAIPRIGSEGRPELPEYLSESELQQLLNSFEGEGPGLQRDHAIVLCVARLGLRAGEVARLSLEDINWRRGTVRLVQTKGRRERQLPLPSELGQTLANYLKQSRPRSCSRALFLSLRNGQPLSSNSISALTVAAFKRAGLRIARPGTHRLRHTFASHLVQRGVSLKAVADLLGHGALSTTQVYAKVNLPLLREVAAPWPKEVRI